MKFDFATSTKRGQESVWISDIRVDSGILVEQGLDEAGDPLIGFSHLTFQEYLAAVAINEDPQYLQLLRGNLLQPTWSEVALLYVALTNDATSTIAHLLDVPAQPAGVLLAGSCLAERVRHVKNETQQQTLDKLKAGFEQADSQTVASFGQVLAAVGGDEVTTFMRGQLHTNLVEKRLEAIKALGHTKPNDSQIKDVQDDLVKLVEVSNDVALAIAARESLAQIGDPRFTGKEPIVVSIPQQACSIPLSPKGWKELIATPEWVSAKKVRQRLPLITRVFDYWLFTKFHPLRQKLPQKHAFEIGKYLITNVEYARFVEATGHHVAEYWIEGTYLLEKATHPVTGITPKDAKAYCQWLSRETEKNYRLPTEWEWEWAATGVQGWRYPWGDQFDKDKCNTTEAAIGETTPVGSYLAGINQYGMTDMSGNVWEITQGYVPSLRLSSLPLSSNLVLDVLRVSMGLMTEAGTLILYLLGVIASSALLIVTSGLLGVIDSAGSTGLTHALILTFSIVIGLILDTLGLLGLKSAGGVVGLLSVLRGGAFNISSDQATCFFRGEYSDSLKEIGFRCVRDS